jgi:ATP-binding cassette subfamily C protein
MKQVFKIFFGAEDTRPFLVLFCLLLAGIAEAASISTVLPAMTAIAGGDQASSSSLNATIRSFIASLGIEPKLENLIILAASLMIFKALISFGALSYAGLSAARVAIALRRRLVSALFEAQWGFFAEQSAGRFANAISNDSTRAGDAYVIAGQIVAYSLQVLAYASVALLMDWKLALAGLAAGAVVAVATGGLVRIARRAGFKQTDNTSGLTVIMVDMLNNIKALKTMERYAPLLGSMAKTMRKIKRSLVTRELARNGLYQASDALTVVLVGAGVYFAHIVWRTPLPELMVSGIVFFQIVSSIARLQKFLQVSAQVESAYLRTTELIELAESNKQRWFGTRAPKLGAGCRFEDVSFAHGSTPVLNHVNLEFPSRGITVLSGPSGAGKTTIIDLLIGLHVPAAGRIFIGEDPIETVDIKAWRRQIGYVPQELSLLHASVRTNITLGDDAISDADVVAALRQAGAESFVAGLANGLDTDVGEMGGKLSGGQRQRISLARALVAKPEMLILDEVTSALDPRTEAEILENIVELGKRYTIVSITHRPAWTSIAGNLYQVTRGRVRAVAKPAKVRAGSS